MIYSRTGYKLNFSRVKAILRGCVLFTILLYIIEKEHLYFNVNLSRQAQLKILLHQQKQNFGCIILQ